MATAARPDSPARSREDQSPGTEGEGQNRDVGRGAKKRKKLQKSYKRDVENGRDLYGKKRKRKQESISRKI